MRDNSGNYETPAEKPPGYTERDCPYCSQTVKDMPAHLRNQCSEVADLE